MNKDEILKEINITKKRLADLEEMLTQYEYERWKPENGREYYYTTTSCRACNLWWYDTADDEATYSTYNCFKTREEAEQEAEKILIRRQLEDIARRLNKGVRLNWDKNEQSKYYIELYGNNIITNFFYAHKAQGTVYCLDENFIDVAIQEIGEERLKKYLRGE